LKNGGSLRAIVGVDLDNTSKEGLDELIALKTHGSVNLFVHHNEAGTVFHPKLYLFRNTTAASLIVGSNNLTEAGLFRNTEAGLAVDVEIGNPVVTSVVNALDGWADPSLGLAKELDTKFLDELVANGYVKSESTLRAEAASRRSSSTKGGSGKKLFGSVQVTAPSRSKASSSVNPNGHSSKKTKAAPIAVAKPTSTGQVLLMRVRKAHVTDRPTQTQVPKEVAQSPFFNGISAVTSVHTGNQWRIRQAMARGIVNTLKLEIPEMRHMSDPVIRFERTNGSIQYEVYDAATSKGQAIMQGLRTGLKSPIPSTQLTKPSSPATATWWRFI
jgi:hypothetical protein